jgi:hypothetical protein
MKMKQQEREDEWAREQEETADTQTKSINDG